jgi:hypothetical protein
MEGNKVTMDGWWYSYTTVIFRNISEGTVVKDNFTP